MTFVCDRCGKKLEGEEVSKDLFLPVEGFLVWAPFAEVTSCEACSGNPESWPWWGEFGLEGGDELAVLYARYDCHTDGIALRDRCWN